MLSNSLAIVKTYAIENLGRYERPKAFTYLGAIWCIGVMAGTELSGALSFPATHLTIIFGAGGFWTSYPYFLPLLISAGVSLVGAGFMHNQLNDIEETSDSGLGLQIDFNKTAYTLVLVLSTWVFTSFQELFPIWARASRANGGLNWSEPASVGEIQSIGALVGVLVQCYIVKHEIELSELRGMLAILVPGFVVFSFANELNPIVEWCILALCQACFTVVHVVILCQLYLAFNVKSKSDYNIDRAQYGSAAARALSPFIMCSVMAWSFANGFPFDSHLPFFVLAILSLACIVVLSFKNDTSYKEVLESNLRQEFIEKV